MRGLRSGRPGLARLALRAYPSLVKRATTLTGLLLQTLRVRWDALGKRGKVLFIAVSVLTGIAAAQMGACYLGACEASSPCNSPCSVERGAAQSSDQPCSLRSQGPAESAALADETR